MSQFFETAGCKIFARSGKIVFDGAEISVRPKTFQLLVLLVSSKEIISKQQILEEIWDDVFVDEQVIFQSIKELRKIFAGKDVIKTYPRKGYVWTADVQVLVSEHHTKNEIEQDTKRKPSATMWLSGGLSLLVFAVILYFLIIPNTPAITGSVVVLPVKNNIEDTNHQWVRYGAMDQIIQRLSSGDEVGVLNTDYVMEVMKRANMPMEGFGREHIEKVFVVSGTTLVVEAALAGNSSDYKLIYNLHQKNGTERGVILEQSIGVAIDKLAHVINQKLGNKINAPAIPYQSAFANEMLAEAIQMKDKGDSLGSKELLEAITVTDPGNLTAKRLLLELAIQSVDTVAADSILADAIPRALDAGNTKELIRLRFFSAMNAVHKGDVELGQKLIEDVKVQAESIKDWLYLAYAYEFTGLLNQRLANYELAQQSFETAIGYHQVLQCPLGQSNGLMHLSVLAHVQGDLDVAKYNAKRSLDIIEKRELLTKKPGVESWIKQIEAHQ